MAEKSETTQCGTFLHIVGEEAINVYNTFQFTAEEVNKIDELKNKFKEYCEPRKNLPYIRHMFFTRAQGTGETIDAYVTDLKHKAKDCEFGDLTDSLIRDRIECGIKDDNVCARLLREEDLTLQKAIDTCRANEITSNQMKMLVEEVDENKISSVRNIKKRGKTVQSEQHTMECQHKAHTKCSRCGYQHEFKKCPAYGQMCKACNKRNHFAKMCKTQVSTKKKKYRQ